MSNKIYIYEEKSVTDVVVTRNNDSTVSICEPESKILRIYERGPKGDRGERGPSGNESNPFYVIDSTHFATSASLSFYSYISSSIIPEGNFNLGSTDNNWYNIFISKSIFINNNKIIESLSNTQQTLKLTSGSVSSSFNENGIFLIPEHNTLPLLAPGGIIKFNNDFYLGT